MKTITDHKARIIDSRILIQIALFTSSERDGWVHPNLAYWLATTMDNEHYRILVSPVHGIEPKSAARNTAIEIAIKNNADYLLMVDNDCAPDPELLGTFVELDTRHDIWSPITYRWDPGQGCSVPVFASRRVFTKAEKEEALKKADSDELREAMEKEFDVYPQFEPDPSVSEQGLCEVSGHVATPIFCLHHRVFKGMTMPVFREVTDLKSGRRLVHSDLDFFARAHDLKFRMWVDTRRVCGLYRSLDMAELNFKTAMLLERAKSAKSANSAKSDISDVEAIAQEATKELVPEGGEAVCSAHAPDGQRPEDHGSHEGAVR